MGNFCYIPLPVDKECAKFMGCSDRRAATIRGIYDEAQEAAGKPLLDTSNPEQMAKTLSNYLKTLRRSQAMQTKASGVIMSHYYKTLRNSFTTKERVWRTNMIAQMFMDELQKYQREHPDRELSEIINGFQEEGVHKGGQFSLFDNVLERIIDLHQINLNDGKTEVAEAYREVVRNWEAFLPYVRITLKSLLGINLNNAHSSSTEATFNDFETQALMELYTPEETTHEAWQQSFEFISAFSLLDSKVRQILGTIPAITYKKVGDRYMYVQEKDDLGYNVYLNPSMAMNMLLETCIYVQNSKEMLTRISANPILAPLMDILQDTEAKSEEANTAAKYFTTKLFCTLKSFNFQPYTMITKNKKGSSFKMKLLNKVKDTAISRKRKFVPLTEGSIFDKENKVVRDKAVSLRERLAEALGRETGDELYKISGNFYKLRKPAQFKFVMQALQDLGIDVSADVLKRVLANAKHRNNLLKYLKTIGIYGLDRVTEGASYDALIKRASQAVNSGREGVIEENFRKMSELFITYQEGLQMESSVLWKDSKGVSKKYYSFVTANFLGDRIGTIANYVQRSYENDIEAKRLLREYLEKEYKDCPIFYNKSTDTWLNEWLNSMITACKSSRVPLYQSWVANFAYSRDLGSTNTDFKDLSAKNHTISMLTYFLDSKASSRNMKMAMYPVFVLGDSGTSKYINSKIYDIKTLLEGFYNVYLQELKRQQLAKATTEKLKELGYEDGIENFEKSANTFSFLNEPEIKELGKNASKEEIQEAIKKMMARKVEEFTQKLKDMGVLATTKTGKYKYFDLLTPQNVTKAITEAYWNMKYATIQQLQLFTIDPAFYMGAEDLQKRYKELHAPGSVCDLDAIDPHTGKKFSEDGIERVIYFNDIKAEATKEFLKIIEKMFPNNPEIVAKYKKNTLTDGQGYRTLDGYKKVMGMQGKWTTQMEEAYQEIKNLEERYGDEIPADAITRISQLAAIFQPIKPFFYGFERFAVNDEDVMLIPVQHKYSESILIPALLPKASKLRAMAKWMDENNVDMACSTKSVKVGIFGSTDISELQDAESLKIGLSKAYVHQLSYADYRQQTNVPAHTYGENLFGTQPRKLAMMDVDKGANYSRYFKGKAETINVNEKQVEATGDNLLKFYSSLHAANFRQAYKELQSRLTKKELSELLIQTVINLQRQTTDNIEAFSLTSILEEDGTVKEDFMMPLFEGFLAHDTEALLLSILKNDVLKQKILGGSLVQASALGISGYERRGDLRYVCENDNVLYAQCEVPFDFVVQERDTNGKLVDKALDFDKYCNSDGTFKTDAEGNTLIEKDYAGILDIVAYRIPTESLYSMLNLKIVRCSPKIAGGTIKVPLEATTIAGFDFDIDKLYLIRKQFSQTKEGKWHEYDYKKSADKNSKIARNNELLRLMQLRLSDPETLRQRLTPGGFDNSKRAAKQLRILLEKGILLSDTETDADPFEHKPKYDISDPLTIVKYNEQNQIAGKLIGIFANHNVNHVLFTFCDRASITTPISFCGHSYSNLRTPPKGVNVSLHLAELLAASVDAVKDPILNDLGINTITADAACLLIRLGYTHLEVGLLLNQPIIKELCTYCLDNNVGIQAGYSYIQEKYAISEQALAESQNINVSKQALVKGIINRGEDTITGEITQTQVLATFQGIIATASALSQNVLSSKNTASNSIGATIGEMLTKLDRVEEAMRVKEESILEIGIGNSSTMLSIKASEEDSPFQYEQIMLNNIMDFMKRALQHVFPYFTNSYVETRSCISDAAKYRLNGSTIDSIHKDFLTYRVLSQAPDMVVPFDSKDGGAVSAKEYYTQQFAARLYNFLEANPLYQQLPIFKNIQYTIEEDMDGTKKVTECYLYGVGGEEAYTKNDIIDSWRSLGEWGTDKALAEQLFWYNMYKMGYSFSPFSFAYLAPASLKSELAMKNDKSYVQVLRDILTDAKSVNYSEFTALYILNHLDNKAFVLDASTNVTMNKALSPLIANSGGIFKESFDIDVSRKTTEFLNNFMFKYGTDEQGNIMYKYPPVISYTNQNGVTAYYMCNIIGTTRSVQVKYTRVMPAGVKGRFLNYSGSIEDFLFSNRTIRTTITTTTNTIAPLNASQTERKDNQDSDLEQRLFSSGKINSSELTKFLKSTMKDGRVQISLLRKAGIGTFTEEHQQMLNNEIEKLVRSGDIEIQNDEDNSPESPQEGETLSDPESIFDSPRPRVLSERELFQLSDSFVDPMSYYYFIEALSKERKVQMSLVNEAIADFTKEHQRIVLEQIEDDVKKGYIQVMDENGETKKACRK